MISLWNQIDINAGGSVDYAEFVHCGKARDITFAGINMFEMKISGGNALQACSRDMSRMGENLDVFRLLSFFHTSVGFFFMAMLLHVAVAAMVIALIAFALTDAEAYNSEDLDNPWDIDNKESIGRHSYGAEFVVQLGFTKVLPLFLEYWLEASFWTAVKVTLLEFFYFKQNYTLFVERTPSGPAPAAGGTSAGIAALRLLT